MLAAFCAVGSLKAQSVGTILFEDFSTLRMNRDSPAAPLWQPYPNPSGGSDYANQTGAIENGTYHLHTAGRPYIHFTPYPYVDPAGFARQNLRSGVWNANVNRLRFWIKTSRSISRRSDGGTIAEVGTYTKNDDGQPSNQGDHYYHYLDPNFIAGQWMLVTLNRVPQHEVGQTDPNGSYPENPSRNGQFAHSPYWDYFDGLTRLYFCDEYGSAADWNGDYYFANFQFDTVTGEPDSLVATVTAVYTGDHYEISWMGPKNVVQAYTVYMAPASMKAKGVGSGTVVGTSQTGGYAYAGVLVASKSMAQPSSGMYFAIQPAGQTSFTEVYLPATLGAPPSPVNVRIVH